MRDSNENYPDETLPEEELIEVEPDKEKAGDIINFVDLKKIAEEERNNFFNPPIPEA